MNTTHEEAVALINAIIKNNRSSEQILKLVFPPFPYLKEVTDLLRSVNGFTTGAQNCSSFQKGAYTGEVSAAMIHSVGANYVLVGHSERRIYFKENNQEILNKIKQALSENLRVVFCVGELIEERKSGKHFETVKGQLKEVLQEIPQHQMQSIIVAYEPVWAIGTGETASPAQAQEMHLFIRQTISELFDKNTSDAVSILYGGSCNAQNAKELFSCTDVDGGLIGGASLNAGEFCKITESF